MLRWTEPKPDSKTKRSRLDCGKGFSIIEDPLKNGKSYRLEIRPKNAKKYCIRMDKTRIQDRDAAYEEHLRLRIRIAEEGDTKVDLEVKTFSDGVPIYLRDKKADNLRSLGTIEKVVLNRLEPYFGDLRLSDIKLQTLKKYRDYRRKTVSDATVKIEIGYLKEYFNLMIDSGHYGGTNPVSIRKLKLQITEREIYMKAEQEAKIWPLLRKYPPMEDLADFHYGTTMRPGNICNLQWERIRWDEKIAFVPKEEHKQKEKDGQYKLTPKVLKMLKQRYKENQENGKFPYVFCRYEEKKSKKITVRWIQRKWQKIMEEAEIVEDLRFYDLKHTRLSRVATLGASVLQLKEISNHSSTQSLEKYVKGDALKKATLELLERVDEVWADNGVKTGSKK